jgi:hypothetical protein
VLDLDETLISSTSSGYGPHIEYHGLYMHVRPYLRELLLFLDRNYEIVIWTWADFEYAEFVVETFIRPIIPIHRNRVFSRELGKQSQRGFMHDGLWCSGHKNLFLLADTMKEDARYFFIIDNRWDVAAENGSSGVKVSSWVARAHFAYDDMTLLALIHHIQMRFPVRIKRS